jgi:uncharacterized membrane protein required for colicin V production
MKLEHLPVNWFDFTVIIVLCLGLVRGRKNGLSQELILMIQWLGIIFGAAFSYIPVGDFLHTMTVFSLLFLYVLSYIVAAAVIKIFFSAVKKAVGGKLVGSDIFGRGEYYIGALAGMVRFACIIVFFLAPLNARFFAKDELTSMHKYRDDVYGKSYWPTLDSVQSEVFKNSWVGPRITDNIPFLLIKPTAPEKKDLKRKEFQLP